MVQTYDEFKVVYDGKKIIEKKPTKRGSVRISAFTANINNQYSESTGLYYVLNKKKSAEVDEKIKSGK